MVAILAIDPATLCGWAYRRRSKGSKVVREEAGTWDLRNAQEKIGRLWDKLEKNFLGTQGGEWLSAVAVEQPTLVFGRRGQARTLTHHAKLAGVVELWCLLNNIPYKEYPPTKIKKHATGKGNANKMLVTAAAIERWGRDFVIDDNTADALYLLDLAFKEYEEGTFYGKVEKSSRIRKNIQSIKSRKSKVSNTKSKE